MTTVSVAYIGRMALRELASENPALAESIARISSGPSIGTARIVRVHFKDGRYRQFRFGSKGTHTEQLKLQLLEELKAA